MTKTDLSLRKNQVLKEDVSPIGERPYSASRLVIQRHSADKAGEHYDMRLDFGSRAISFATKKGLPAPGAPVQLFRQPDHTVSYMDWEGEIPKGEYGAGQVQKAMDVPVIVKSTSDRIYFTIPDGENKGTYAALKKDDKNWLLVKKKELERSWAPKPKYREDPPEGFNEKDYIGTEKLDGAHFFADLNPGGIAFTSQRKSVGGDLIAREDNVPHLRDLKVPKKYQGLTLRGELWHDKGFNTVSGILNSKPQNAVEKQRREGEVRYAPFRIHKGPNGEENLPYEEQLKILRDLSKDLPHYFEPPKEAEPGSFKSFYESIGRSKGEGMVLVHKETGQSYKQKHRFDYDLKIAGFTDGTGKYEGKAVGAINLVDKTGRDVGKVGTGLSDQLRVDMYRNPNRYLGKLVKVQSRKPLVGKLREPSFLGFTTDQNEPDEVI